MSIIVDSSQVGVAKIGYRNLFNDATGTVVASSETVGFEKENAYDWLGYDWWRPSTLGDNWLEVSFASAKQVDYMAVFGHDLSDHAATIKAQYSTNGGSTWLDASTLITPGNNNTIFVFFDTVNVTHYRVLVNATGSYPSIAGVMIGEALQFPHNMEIGFAPPSLAPHSEVKTARSESGIFLGGSKISEGIEGNFTFTKLDPEWVRNEWIPFVNHTQEPKPFVFAWDTVLHGNEVVLAWINGKVKAPVYDESLYMSVRLRFEGTL